MPPWFRFYSEALNDRKIKYVCRATGQPKATVIGTWAMLMALASDSPVRGALLLTVEIPFKLEDLAGELELPRDVTASLLQQFEQFDMLHLEGEVYCLTHWDKRQFTSDDSSERVRRYRERQGQSPSPECNGDETLQGRDGSAPEQNRTETDTEQTTETEQTTTETAVTAAVQAMEEHGMTNAQDVLGETDLMPSELIGNVAYAKAEGLGADWVRQQSQQNRAHSPPDPAADRRRFIEGEYVQH